MKTEDELREWARDEAGKNGPAYMQAGGLEVGYREGAKDARVKALENALAVFFRHVAGMRGEPFDPDLMNDDGANMAHSRIEALLTQARKGL